MNPVERIASIITTISVAGGAGEQVDLWALASELSDIGVQVEEMQKTLEWYAEDRNWSDGELQRIEYPEVVVTAADIDGGQRARDTLKQLKGAQHE